jgi:hypothetical protein
VNPIVSSPTVNAIIQILIAAGVVCSFIEPWVARWPAVHALVSRIAGAGLDVRKIAKGGVLPSDTSDDQPPPATPKSGTLGAIVCLVCIAVSLVACADLLKAKCAVDYQSCVDKSATRAEYEACRANVDASCLTLPAPTASASAAPSATTIASVPAPQASASAAPSASATVAP